MHANNLETLVELSRPAFFLYPYSGIIKLSCIALRTQVCEKSMMYDVPHGGGDGCAGDVDGVAVRAIDPLHILRRGVSASINTMVDLHGTTCIAMDTRRLGTILQNVVICQ